MTDNRKFEIFLQPFEKEISNKYICELTCSKCNEKVISTSKIQSDLATGGIGHKCKKCNTYLALVQCPNCNTTLTIDHEEWRKLAEHESNCPTCNAIIYRKKESWRPKITNSGILLL